MFIKYAQVQRNTRFCLPGYQNLDKRSPAMKNLLTSLISTFFVTLLLSFSSFAATPIATCVDEQGDLTYTDHFCETAFPENNPNLMTENATSPTIRARIPSVIRAEAIASNTIKSATNDARSECEQRFVKYFKRKHPSIKEVPNVNFSRVVDQFLKGSNISVSLSGNVEYIDNDYTVFSNVECTVQRFKASSDWMVGYRER